MLRRPRTGGLPTVPAVAPAAPPATTTPLEPIEGTAPALPPDTPSAASWSPGAAHASPHAHTVPASPTASPVQPSAQPAPSAVAAAQARWELDGLALYPHLHRVEAAGREIALTPTEFLLLETLLRSGQVVRSKAELARTVRGDDADGGTFVSKADERTVEVHVGNLRRKLAEDPNEPRWLQTVRGVGYRMAGRPLAVS